MRLSLCPQNTVCVIRSLHLSAKVKGGLVDGALKGRGPMSIFRRAIEFNISVLFNNST